MNTSEILGGSVGSPGRVQRSPLSQKQDYMSKYTWRKHDVEELHNSDDLQEISKLAHLAILRLRDALWRRNGNPIKLGAIPTSILYERAEWESVQHEVMPFFEFDEVGVFCADILEQVSHAEGVRQAKSRAGKTSAQVRNQHMLNTCSTDVQHMSEQNPTRVQQRRGEEKREEEIRGDDNALQPLRNAEETKGDKPRARQKKQVVLFIPPTQEQVNEYMQSRGWKDPAFWSKQWFEHYRDDDWKVKGGKKMTDWQKAVRTWERPERLKQFSPSAHPEWDL